MATRTKTDRRKPLNRELVFQAAVELADEGGLGAVTMRRLADKLGVEAMSLYYHVANKQAILDGVVDALVTEIEDEVGDFDAPAATEDWKTAVRERILGARRIMLRHRWAPQLLESRTKISAPMMRYFNSLLGLMRAGGFSYDLAHHALHALGSRALGFNQELFNPGTQAAQIEEDMYDMLGLLAKQLPHLAGMMSEIAHDDPDSTIGWCDDQTEFEFGLDLILDGLEAKLREP
ncbi:MAG: TetR/AcrR family transcriptional regulator C-terminal domain-containing protein [Acidimicrobiia bacterium]|nr:TetR/AcrR family transcriptional regulator C-terminal domain-containing protein [Acidimicrobiia bacterium]